MGSLKYTTIDGDTFDIIALDMYNNEFLAGRIALANPTYAGVIIFDAGVVLDIPIIDAATASPTLPPWRQP